jgi:thiol-disulfide isomerase/thioredoxin
MGLTGLITGAAVLAVALIFGLWRRAHPSSVKLATVASSFDFGTLGVRPGQVTLLQFSSAFCAPCRATRVRCEQLAAAGEAAHVEIDAESHLEVVRALGIWKTPTTLLLDAHGNVAGRIQGVPTLGELRAAIGAINA